MCEQGRENENKKCQRELRTTKRWKEIVRERKEKGAACIGRAMRSWKLANISATTAEENQHPSPEWACDSCYIQTQSYLSVGDKVNQQRKEIEKSDSGPAAEQWGRKWKKKRNRKLLTRKKNINWPIPAGEAPKRIHLRAGLYPVCVLMEMGLLSAHSCTNWQ